MAKGDFLPLNTADKSAYTIWRKQLSQERKDKNTCEDRTRGSWKIKIVKEGMHR